MKITAFFSFLALTSFSSAAPALTLVDDFAEAKRHNRDRLVITDKDVGSESTATIHCTDGILSVKGSLKPGRGVPAFISVPIPIAPDFAASDASRFEGVLVRLKVNQGLITLQVATTDVTNFDFHTSAPLAAKRGTFTEVKVPFKGLRRSWSEQTDLKRENITSLNLVAFGMAADVFEYEVDEIRFY